MNNDILEMQKAFAQILLQEEGQRICKFANNDIWVDGNLIVENGEIIK